MKYSSFLLYLFFMASYTQFTTLTASVKPTPKTTYSTLLPITDSEINAQIEQLNNRLDALYLRIAQGHAIAANFKDQVQLCKQRIANLEAFRRMHLNDRLFHAALQPGELYLVDDIIKRNIKPSQTRVTIDKLIRSLTDPKSTDQRSKKLRLLEHLLVNYSINPNILQLGDHTPALPEYVHRLEADSETKQLLLETIQKADLSWKTRRVIIPYQPDSPLNTFLAALLKQTNPRP